MSEETLLKILQLILPLSTTGIAVVAVLLYLFSHPEKFDQWGNLFYRLLGFLGQRWSWLAERAEHGQVAWSIQDTVNTIGTELSRQAPGILPHALRIEWVKATDPEAFFRDGEVVVRLSHHSNQDKNIVMATLAYLGKGLLPRARQYLDNSLRQATDFAIARYILGAARGTGASDYLITNVLLPAFEKVPQLQDDSVLLDDLEGVGFLTRVFLHEVRELGERIFPAIPNERTASEIRHFAGFLQVIEGCA
jgi:hypothetical protein